MSRRGRNGSKNGSKPRAEDVDFAGALADKSEQGAGTNPCISSCHTSLAKALQNFVCAENDGDRIPVTAAEFPPGDAAGGDSVVDNNAADVVMEDQKSERSGSDGTGPLPKPMLADFDGAEVDDPNRECVPRIPIPEKTHKSRRNLSSEQKAELQRLAAAEKARAQRCKERFHCALKLWKEAEKKHADEAKAASKASAKRG